jgi:uncharacterized protein (TIGR02453 family)
MENQASTEGRRAAKGERPRRGRFFGPELFEFLLQLRAHNDRDWFLANKLRYESAVREPFLRFITAFAPRLKQISPFLVADPRPNGGSLMRIYRDLRFSKDKTPYRTQAAASFWHRDTAESSTPGFYLDLSPGESFLGTGLWHPDASSLKLVRKALIDRADVWKRIISSKAFAACCELDGEALQRPPKGYDLQHPLIADLKRKDFVTTTPFSDRQVCAPDFLERFVVACRAAAPFVGFLTRAVELPF